MRLLRHRHRREYQRLLYQDAINGDPRFDLYQSGQSNPTVIEHRRILKAAVESAASAKNEEQARRRQEAGEEQAREQQAERDYQKRFWWIVACGVGLGLLLVYYQFREVVRRFRRVSRTA